MSIRNDRLLERCLARAPGLDHVALGARLQVLAELTPQDWVPDTEAFVSDLLCLCTVLKRIEGPSVAHIHRQVAKQIAEHGDVQSNLCSYSSARLRLVSIHQVSSGSDGSRQILPRKQSSLRGFVLALATGKTLRRFYRRTPRLLVQGISSSALKD